jgi:segregation and condensation protein A
MLRVLTQPRTDQQSVTSVLPRPRFLVRDKIAHIARILGNSLSTKFFNLLRVGQPRAEVVATFLAVLELVRRHMVHATQPEAFGDIDIERAPAWQMDKVSALESDLDEGGTPALQPAG